MSRLPWTVISVFEPDQAKEWAPYSYTVGVADLLGVELFMWAQPTEGDDLGVGFELTPHDRTLLINDVAERLIDGTLTFDSEVRQELDLGLSALLGRFAEPVPGNDVGANAVPDIPVVVVGWQLERRPTRDRTPADPAWQERISCASAHLGLDVVVIDETEPWGPAHHLIEAILARFATWDEPDLEQFDTVVVDHAEQHGFSAWRTGYLLELARTEGYSAALAEIQQAALQIINEWNADPTDDSYVPLTAEFVIPALWCVMLDGLATSEVADAPLGLLASIGLWPTL